MSCARPTSLLALSIILMAGPAAAQFNLSLPKIQLPTPSKDNDKDKKASPSQPSASSPKGAAKQAASRPPSSGTPVADAFAKTTFATVGDQDAEQWLKSLGVDTANMWTQDNPSPEWLLYWQQNKISYDHQFASDTLVQAAINKTWEVACAKDYASLQAAFADIRGSAEWKDAFAATSYYDRMDKLRTVFLSAGDKLIGGGLVRINTPLALFGPMHELVREIARTNEAHGTPDLTDPMLTSIVPVNFARDLQSGSGEALSEKVYCALASKLGGSKNLPPLRRILKTSIEAKKVAWPALAPRAEVDAELSKHVGIPAPKEGTPAGVRIAYKNVTVTKVETKGKSTAIHFVVKEERTGAEPTHCKKVGRKFEGGRWIDDLACQYPTITSTEKVKVEAELPSRLVPKRGDVVTLTIQVKREPKWTTKGRGKKVTESRNVTGKLFHLSLLSRDGKALGVY